MERIVIIGCGGAGKSTLARQLGEKLNIPVVHLDKLWWKPNWVESSREVVDAKLAVELAKPRWIMDGNFNRTIELRLDACDTVIYLDYPRFVCLKSWLGRVIRNWGRARPDMAAGCAERFDLEFAKWIWNFNKTKRPIYHELLRQTESKNVVILKSRRQARRFLDSL